jgi:hypothetical protein
VTLQEAQKPGLHAQVIVQLLVVLCKRSVTGRNCSAKVKVGADRGHCMVVFMFVVVYPQLLGPIRY